MTEREKLIIDFYEDGEIPFWLKLIEYIKERKNEHRNFNKLDSTRSDTILDSSNDNSRFSRLYEDVINKVRNESTINRTDNTLNNINNSMGNNIN